MIPWRRSLWRAGASVAKPGKVLAAVGATVGGLTAMNRALAKVGEPAGIGGEERRYLWRGWRLAYQVAGEDGAPPLLLVHGVYAGASSYEFRRNFHELAKDFRVYALDLLGCGRRPRARANPGALKEAVPRLPARSGESGKAPGPLGRPRLRPLASPRHR